MPRQQTKGYVITLSIPQHKFVEQLIETHKALGDCNQVGLKLTFDDYEGLRAFQNAVVGLKTKTTRDYVTYEAIFRKLDQAVTAYLKRKRE